MAVKTREELMTSLNTLLGENNSDEALSFLDDVSDTYDDLTRRANSDEDWETKYSELDAEWRERYRQRFNEPYEGDDGDNFAAKNTQNKPLTFENLFKEE